MTDTRDKVLEQALEALELCLNALGLAGWEGDYSANKAHESIAAIKEELAKPAPEPVKYIRIYNDCGTFEGQSFEPLYRAPPPPKMPEGWQLVPKKMPRELEPFICNCDNRGKQHANIEDNYADMLAACPQPS